MITIYSTKTCPRCSLLKDAFKKANIAYEEHPLDSVAISDCLVDTGELVNSAPLVKDGAAWFMSDDFFDSSGNLKANGLVELRSVRPHKEFTGMGGQPDAKVRSSSKIWGQ